MNNHIKKILYIVSACILILSNSIAETTPNARLALTYVNQRGSTLILNWDETKKEGNSPTGTLTGVFTSAVGKCATGVPFPITGVFNGNAIAITLNLAQCKQVIAMTGHASEDKNEIHMLWLDAAQVAESQTKDWNSNIIGADYYKAVK